MAAGILAGIATNSLIDLSTLSSENQFIDSLIHNSTLNLMVNTAKFYLGLAIAALGACVGLITFGIGIIMSKITQLNR